MSDCCQGGCNSTVKKTQKAKSKDFYLQLFSLIISTISLILSFFEVLKFSYFDFAFIAIFVSGVPIVYFALKTFFTKAKITSALLVTVALIAAIFIKEYFAAGEVALIMQLGGFLETITINRAKKGVKKLLSLTPLNSNLKIGNTYKIVPTNSLKINDIIIVKVGETVSVDGVIISGETAIDQSAITGEGLPVDKVKGDQVFEGTLNRVGVIEVKVLKVGEESSIKKMVKLVEEAEANRAPVVKLADKLASFFVPTAIILAIIVGVLTKDITRAVTIMVVFCPCSLVLATPTAIMAAIGRASKNGIIIKSADAIESVNKLDVIAFDKTGTITTGNLEVTNIISTADEKEFLTYVVSAENLSEHPISRAIISYGDKKNIKIEKIENFKSILGKGIVCSINGKNIAIGNKSLLDMLNIDENFANDVKKFQQEGKKVLSVAIDKIVVGIIAISDTIKKDVKNVISEINTKFKIETVMITGDNSYAGKYIGEQISVSNIYSECLPEGKVAIIKNYVEKNRKIAMVGDGVNDAPALSTATVGIAMGKSASDITIDSADITLVNDDISVILKLLKSVKSSMLTIKLNIGFSLFFNVTAITLASLGVLNPVLGALAHNIGSLIVVINSVLLYYRK